MAGSLYPPPRLRRVECVVKHLYCLCNKKKNDCGCSSSCARCRRGEHVHDSHWPGERLREVVYAFGNGMLCRVWWCSLNPCAWAGMRARQQTARRRLNMFVDFFVWLLLCTPPRMWRANTDRAGHAVAGQRDACRGRRHRAKRHAHHLPRGEANTHVRNGACVHALVAYQFTYAQQQTSWPCCVVAIPTWQAP